MIYWIFIIIIASCIKRIRSSEDLYMKDLCRETSSANVMLTYREGHTDYLHLHLSLGLYPPEGFNCCITLSSNGSIVAKISRVHLPMYASSKECIHSLMIITDDEQKHYCEKHERGFSPVIQTKNMMKICFKSSEKMLNTTEDIYRSTVYDIHSPYKFDVRLFAFSYVENPDDCKMEIEKYLCNNSLRCLHLNMLCDGKEDCPTGEDEMTSLCYSSREDDMQYAEEESFDEIEIFPTYVIAVFFIFTTVLISYLLYIVRTPSQNETCPSQSNDNSEMNESAMSNPLSRMNSMRGSTAPIPNA